MFFRGRFIVSLTLCTLPCHADWTSHDVEHVRSGWAWYKEREKTRDVDEEEERRLQAETAKEKLSSWREQLEESLALAVLDPSVEHVSEYMQLQKQLMDQGALFSQLWMQALLSNPHLDSTLERPTSSHGLRAHHRKLGEDISQRMAALGGEYSLVFFYQGGCPLSLAMADSVRIFAEKHKWTVSAYTTDGVVADKFPESEQVSKSMEKAFPLDVLPALFAYKPSSGDVVPIGYGPISAHSMERNILLQLAASQKLHRRGEAQ